MNSLYKKYIIAKRERFKKKLKKRLEIKDFSLITNNCVGGVIYNNLGLKFTSPTVNLYILDEDYILFCEHACDFIKNGVLKERQSEFSYPSGELTCSSGKITIYFMHYSSFQEAESKWQERCKRVNFDNLCFIYEVTDKFDEVLAERFLSLPYKKAIITANKSIKNTLCKYISVNKKFEFGVLLQYKSKLSAKRWLDDWDYVSFLNA